ncbi:terminase family protein [Salmonella enterica]|nr:terminase family protein [Salmonella enterica]
MDFSALPDILTPETLDNLDDDSLQELYEQINAYELAQRRNRYLYFEPLDYQRKFMNAGSKYNIRYLRSGNRIGKTYGAAAEFAYHLTGLYPSWWEGARIENGGHTFWAVGITLDSVATVIQKELFGSANIKSEDVGTGAIPHHTIEFKQGWEPDGSRLRSCQIRHVSGRLNTLRFYGSENVSAMMGQKVAFVWIDEESLNSTEIFTQCKTRTINALGPGKNGYLMITATPEKGNTDLNQLFDRDESDSLYMQAVSWDDCPFFTPERIAEELAGYPKWQWEMRRKGLPVIGTGAIFSCDDDDIRVDEVKPLPHWKACIGLDWGVSHDASVICVCLHNPDTDIHYIYDVIYLDKDDEDRSPANVARIILNSPYSRLPIIVPHDHRAESKQLKNYGCNVLTQVFRNPPQSELKIKKANLDSLSVRDVETGLSEMRFLISENRLKVLSRCHKWFEEKQKYFYTINKNSGQMKRTKPDHAMDASRYGVLSNIGNRGVTWDQAGTYQIYDETPEALELEF